MDEAPPKPAGWQARSPFALAGGSLCAWLKTPLPWMIGPLLAMAIFQFGGRAPRGAAAAGARPASSWSA